MKWIELFVFKILVLIDFGNLEFGISGIPFKDGTDLIAKIFKFGNWSCCKDLIIFYVVKIVKKSKIYFLDEELQFWFFKINITLW